MQDYSQLDWEKAEPGLTPQDIKGVLAVTLITIPRVLQLDAGVDWALIMKGTYECPISL